MFRAGLADGIRFGVKVRVRVKVEKIIDIKVKVPLPLIGAFVANLFLLAKKKLKQKLWQVWNLIIELVELQKKDFFFPNKLANLLD